MNKSVWVGIVLGVVGVSTGVLAATSTGGVVEYANVVAVSPVKVVVNGPHEVCEDVPVTQKAEVKDENQIAGTALGAVVGGLLGSRIGGGKGKTLAAVAGAVGGGYVGNKAQEHLQNGDTYTTTQTQCRTVNGAGEKIVGYDVTYELHGKEGRVRMVNDPGMQVPVRNGKVVLDNQ